MGDVNRRGKPETQKSTNNVTHYNNIQPHIASHTATHWQARDSEVHEQCDTLQQHTTTHYITHCNTLQRTATHYRTLQHRSPEVLEPGLSASLGSPLSVMPKMYSHMYVVCCSVCCPWDTHYQFSKTLLLNVRSMLQCVLSLGYPLSIFEDSTLK